jgi:hypothetical protein
VLDGNGVIQMDGMKMPTDAGKGYILTSDDDGVGTWQGPKTRYVSIPSVAFLPKWSSNTNYHRGTWLYGTENNRSYECVCPVLLPDGALVTQLYIEVDDSETNHDIIVVLRGYQKGTLAELETSGESSFVQNYSTNVISNPLIDNINSYYWLELEWTTGDVWDHIFLRRVRIAYTL